MKPRLINGKTFVLTVTFQHQRRTITLGPIDKTDAHKFTAMVESLIAHRKYGRSLTADVAAWISTISERHRKQLAELGLLDQIDKSMTVEELADLFFEDYRKRLDVRDSTKTQFESAMTRFPKELLAAKLADIEPKVNPLRIHAEPTFSVETVALMRRCEAWQDEHYSRSSWSRANGRLREVGNWAVKRGILDHNPFSLLSKPSQVNEARNVIVSAGDVLAAMEQCYQPDIRLAFAFGRFAGVRLPSELWTLRPIDIDFERSRLKILDSKKRRYRVMPLFTILREELERHRDAVCGWGEFVLQDRSTGRNTTEAAQFNLMKDAVEKAGLEVWPRLRQNLRASCENELLAKGFDERSVTAWLGHTVTVSRAHYQNMADAEFDLAIERMEVSR